jgi:hypothetical protein
MRDRAQFEPLQGFSERKRTWFSTREELELVGIGKLEVVQ